MKDYWQEVKVDGEVFRRGDCAYVISDRSRDLDEDVDFRAPPAAPSEIPIRTSWSSATAACAAGIWRVSTLRS